MVGDACAVSDFCVGAVVVIGVSVDDFVSTGAFVDIGRAVGDFVLIGAAVEIGAVVGGFTAVAMKITSEGTGEGVGKGDIEKLFCALRRPLCSDCVAAIIMKKLRKGAVMWRFSYKK